MRRYLHDCFQDIGEASQAHLDRCFENFRSIDLVMVFTFRLLCFVLVFDVHSLRAFICHAPLVQLVWLCGWPQSEFMGACAFDDLSSSKVELRAGQGALAAWLHTNNQPAVAALLTHTSSTTQTSAGKKV